MVKKERLNFNVDADEDGDNPPRKMDDQETEPLALMKISILVIIMNGFVSYAQFEEKNADFDDHSPEDQSFGTAVLNFLPSILDPGKFRTCGLLSAYKTINVRQNKSSENKTFICWSLSADKTIIFSPRSPHIESSSGPT